MNRMRTNRWDQVVQRLKRFRGATIAFPVTVGIIGLGGWFLGVLPEGLIPSVLWLEALLFGSLISGMTLAGLLVDRHREATHQYEHILETTPDGFWIADIHGQILDVNPAICHMLGYTQNELLGMKIAELEMDEDPEAVHQHIQQIVATGSDRFESQLRRKDGTQLTVEVSATYLPDQGGRFVVFIRDVTTRNAMVRQLQSSENRFRSLVNSMRDIVYTLDTEHRHTGVYGPWVDQAGMNPEDFLGRTAREILGPDYAVVHEQAVDQALEGECVVYEWEGPGAESPAYFQTSLSPMYDGEQIVGVVGVGRDITAKKQTEQSLQDSEHKFREIFHNANDAMYLHALTAQGLPGHFLQVNETACEMLGYTQEEFRWMTPLDINGPDLQEKLSFVMPALFAQGEVRFEGHHQAKDGILIPVEIHAELFELQGEQRVLSVARDISERQQATAALQEQEARFRTIFADSPIGIEIYDAEGCLLDANTACLRMFGVSDIRDIQNFQLFDDPNVSAEVLQQLQQGRTVQYETRFDFEKVRSHQLYPTAKSGYLDLDVQITPIYWTTDQEHSGYLVQVQDITDRKAATAALRVSEERVQMAVDVSGIGLWDWHIPSGALILNEEWATMVGYTLAELKPTTAATWERLVYPNDLARAHQHLEAHFAGESAYYECEIRLRHKSGDWIWVRARGKVVEWSAEGDPERMLGTHMNLTAAKRRERELDRQLTSLQTLVEPLDQGVIVIDASGQITYANRMAAYLVGSDPAQVTNTPLSDYMITTNERSALRTVARRRKETAQQQPLRMEMKTVQSTGVNEALAVDIWPLENEGGFEGALLRLEEPPLTDTSGRADAELDGHDLITLCMQCRQLHTESETWVPLETYLHQVWNTLVSHGLCPECMQETLATLSSPRRQPPNNESPVDGEGSGVHCGETN